MAIVLDQEAFEIHSHGHPDWLISLNDLAVHLFFSIQATLGKLVQLRRARRSAQSRSRSYSTSDPTNVRDPSTELHALTMRSTGVDVTRELASNSGVVVLRAMDARRPKGAWTRGSHRGRSRIAII